MGPDLRNKVLREYDESIHDQQINGFFKDHRFLSNFEPVPILVSLRGEPVMFPTTEHAYQAMKVLNINFWRYVADDPDPRMAKSIGGACLLRKDWEQVKDEIMYQVNLEKYKDSRMRLLLMDTGRAELIENNWWRDSVWGVFQNRGENKLGKILMRIRSEMQYTSDTIIQIK